MEQYIDYFSISGDSDSGSNGISTKTSGTIFDCNVISGHDYLDLLAPIQYALSNIFIMPKSCY